MYLGYEESTNAKVPKKIALSAGANPCCVYQPGDRLFNHFVSVQWFDPVQNKYQDAKLWKQAGKTTATSPLETDAILVLRRK
jgi:hypothetical protein